MDAIHRHLLVLEREDSERVLGSWVFGTHRHDIAHMTVEDISKSCRLQIATHGDENAVMTVTYTWKPWRSQIRSHIGEVACVTSRSWPVFETWAASLVHIMGGKT